MKERTKKKWRLERLTERLVWVGCEKQVDYPTSSETSPDVKPDPLDAHSSGWITEEEQVMLKSCRIFVLIRNHSWNPTFWPLPKASLRLQLHPGCDDSSLWASLAALLPIFRGWLFRTLMERTGKHLGALRVVLYKCLLIHINFLCTFEQLYVALSL